MSSFHINRYIQWEQWGAWELQTTSNNQPQKKGQIEPCKKAFKEASTILEKHSDEQLYQNDGK